jgi:hypothetical protein
MVSRKNNKQSHNDCKDVYSGDDKEDDEALVEEGESIEDMRRQKQEMMEMMRALKVTWRGRVHSLLHALCEIVWRVRCMWGVRYCDVQTVL